MGVDLQDLKKQVDEALQKQRSKETSLATLDNQIRSKSGLLEKLDKSVIEKESRNSELEKSFNLKNKSLLDAIVAKNAEADARLKNAKELEEKARKDLNSASSEKSIAANEKNQALEMAKSLGAREQKLKLLVEEMQKLF